MGLEPPRVNASKLWCIRDRKRSTKPPNDMSTGALSEHYMVELSATTITVSDKTTKNFNHDQITPNYTIVINLPVWCRCIQSQCFRHRRLVR